MRNSSRAEKTLSEASELSQVKSSNETRTRSTGVARSGGPIAVCNTPTLHTETDKKKCVIMNSI